MALPKYENSSVSATNNQSLGNQHESIIQHFKRYLHQNNLELYFSENQNSQTLLDVIADYLSISRQQLHKIICHKFKQMVEDQTLPKKLSFIYSDLDILKQYQKDPELVSFYKITYELVCVIYEVKIVIYTLLKKTQHQYMLNAMIINTKGVQRHIQLARINNNFYRVQQQFHQQQQFSIPSIQSLNSAKSSNNLNSEQKEQKEFKKMREPFQSQKIIVDIQQDSMEKRQRKSPDYASSIGVNKQTQQLYSPVRLVKGKSANFKDTDYVKNQSNLSQYDDNVSLQNIIDKQQQKQLLHNCSNFSKQSAANLQRLQLIHQNNHIQSNLVHNSDMMYYYYMSHQGGYSNPVYPGKSQPYLPYSTPSQSMSPTKNAIKVNNANVNNSPVKSNQPFSPIYSSQQSQEALISPLTPSNQPNSPVTTHVTHPPLQIKEGERYLGRLKFFDEGKNYGFIIMDADDSDLFVHFDDINKAGISKQKLKAYKQTQGYMQVKFSFKVMEYFGKYRQSRKAVELIVLEEP